MDKYRRQLFLDIGQEEMQNYNHWEKENKWGPYYQCPGCLEVISRLWHREGTQKDSQVILLSWGDRLEFSKGEVATICGQSSVEKETIQRKNHRNLQRGLWVWLTDMLHMKRVKFYEAGQKQFPECTRQTLKVTLTVCSSCPCVTPFLWILVEPVTYF